MTLIIIILILIIIIIIIKFYIAPFLKNPTALYNLYSLK